MSIDCQLAQLLQYEQYKHGFALKPPAFAKWIHSSSLFTFKIRKTHGFSLISSLAKLIEESNERLHFPKGNLLEAGDPIGSDLTSRIGSSISFANDEPIRG